MTTTMHTCMLTTFVYAAVTSLATVAAFIPASTHGTDALAWKGLQNLARYEESYPLPTPCNASSRYVRREWSTLKGHEKRNYIQAVQCLMHAPPKTPRSVAPGVRSRYDDFVATHINQTLTIHGTVCV